MSWSCSHFALYASAPFAAAKESARAAVSSQSLTKGRKIAITDLMLPMKASLSEVPTSYSTFSDPDPIRSCPLCVSATSLPFLFELTPTKVPSRGRLHIVGSKIEAFSANDDRLSHTLRSASFDMYVQEVLYRIDARGLLGGACEKLCKERTVYAHLV